MFCPNCGEKIEDLNQKFCAFCGSKIDTPPEVANVVSPTNQSTQPGSLPSYLPISNIAPQPKPITSIKPNIYSKRCLGFSIVALIIGGIGFLVGFVLTIFSLFIPYYGFMLFNTLIGWVIVVILHIMGLIFGITSRTNNSRARELEPPNTIEKVGSVFGVLAIILNSILLVVSLIFLIMSIMARMFIAYP
jgi:hypothetical protein